jgi:hypothetical protein
MSERRSGLPLSTRRGHCEFDRAYLPDERHGGQYHSTELRRRTPSRMSLSVMRE